MRCGIEDLWPRLSTAGIESPRLEARIILASVLNCDSGDVCGREYELTAAQYNRLEEIVARRSRREPLDKILESKDFYKYNFKVNKDVLSPRPDTEILVEAAIKLAWQNKFSSVLDLGCGSGCIFLSILADCPAVFGCAVDVSPAALAVAAENSRHLGVSSRASFVCRSWFEEDFVSAIGRGFDMIVSNPPYIPAEDIDGLDDEVKIYDPRNALDGGVDGLKHYRRLAEVVPALLTPNGRVLLEGGINQAREIAGIFTKAGLTLEAILKDLAGIERCIILKK